MKGNKTETDVLVEEFFASGGEVTVCDSGPMPKQQTADLKRENKNYSMYDYSDADFPQPLDFWSR